MSQPAPGELFGAYRIVRQLGAGGMGTVWEARHTTLDKRVALKTLNQSVALNAEAVARFMREGRAASTIEHPHIVDITGVGVEDGTPYLVMEYLDGEALSSLIERHPNGLSVEAVVDLALPVLDALDCAHAAGVVHRDLKPDNLFLARTRTGDAHPVVLDFGISKVEGVEGAARLTHTSALMGTPYYMSPEQARGAKHLDARSDQFSLGLVLYEALSARRAVSGDSVLEVLHKLTSGEFERLSALRGDLPAPVTAVVERMLATRAEERFASLRLVGAALLPYASERTRVVWQGVFTEQGATPSAAPSVSGRLSTPTGLATTLAGAAGETLAPPAMPVRASRAWVVGGAVGLAVAVGLTVGLAAWTSRGPATAALPIEEPTHGVTRSPPPREQRSLVPSERPRALPSAALDLGVQPVVATPTASAAVPTQAEPLRAPRPRGPRVEPGERPRVGANGAAIIR